MFIVINDMHRTVAYIIIFNASYCNEYYHLLSCICGCILMQRILPWLTASFWCVVYYHAMLHRIEVYTASYCSVYFHPVLAALHRSVYCHGVVVMFNSCHRIAMYSVMF